MYSALVQPSQQVWLWSADWMMIVDDYSGINVDNNDDNGDNEAQSREREI